MISVNLFIRLAGFRLLKIVPRIENLVFNNKKMEKSLKKEVDSNVKVSFYGGEWIKLLK